MKPALPPGTPFTKTAPDSRFSLHGLPSAVMRFFSTWDQANTALTSELFIGAMLAAMIIRWVM